MKKILAIAGITLLMCSCSQNTEDSITRITLLEEKVKYLEAQIASVAQQDLERHGELRARVGENTVMIEDLQKAIKPIKN